jgi:hypothetical protein
MREQSQHWTIACKALLHSMFSSEESINDLPCFEPDAGHIPVSLPSSRARE